MEKSNLFDFHSCPRYPLEMHVVYFKAKYIYYEEAAKYEDGVVFEVHFFYVQEETNDSLSPLIEKLSDVHTSGTSVAVEESALARYFNIFMSDYFLYSGTIMSGNDRQRVTWIICRHPSGVSNSQMNEFRKLLDQEGSPLIRNSHKIYKIGKRKIYHVNGSAYVAEILYPFPKISSRKTEKLRIRFQFKPSNKVNIPAKDEQTKRKEEMIKYAKGEIKNYAKEELRNYAKEEIKNYTKEEMKNYTKATIKKIAKEEIKKFAQEEIKKKTYVETINVNENKKIINDKSRIMNSCEKQNIEPVLHRLNRKNIIDSVVHWLHHSVLQNIDGMKSLYETELEKEEEESSVDKESTIQVLKTKICDSVTLVKNKIMINNKIKNNKTCPNDEYILEQTPLVKSTDFQSLQPNPQKATFKLFSKRKSYSNVKMKLNRKNKVNLFSDLDSNFTQELMNKSKLENDGIHINNVGENVSSNTKPMGSITKNIKKINSKQYFKVEHRKKGINKEQERKLKVNSGRVQSSETLTKSIITGFKNMYLKYKNDDNRNSLNINNKTDLNNNNKKDTICSTETNESSKDFNNKVRNDNQKPVRRKTNDFKRIKNEIEIDIKNEFDSGECLNLVSLNNDDDNILRNITSEKLYYAKQWDSKEKLKSDQKQSLKSLDILTPLKLDLDLLPSNFKAINDQNERKDQEPRKKSCKCPNEAAITCNDSTRKKHKRIQTLKISKSSSSGANNIIYISNRSKKNKIYRRASDTSIDKSVKLKSGIRKYSNHEINTQFKNDTRNNGKFSKNRGKCTFGDVKIKKTSSHESVYIFIKKSIDGDHDTKKKPGILYEWLLSAKDLITGPKASA